MPSRRELLDRPTPRRFQLYRREDVHSVSGTGIVAEGIEFRDNSVAYKWLTSPGTLQYAETIDGVEAVDHIHGHNGRTAIRWLDDNQETTSKTVEELYEDRNRLALAFSTSAILLSSPYSTNPNDYAGGWHLPDADDADADEWAIVWAETPAGQVSWHVPRDLAEITGVERDVQDYDGHTRQDKNDRVLEYAKRTW